MADVNVRAPGEAEMAGHVVVPAGELQWKDAPPILPPGAKIAVLEGDPAKSGLFTVRLKLPANYKIMPHWHPADEHVTIISGGLHIRPGEQFKQDNEQPMTTGAFAVMPAAMRHYAWTDEESVLQLHGIGPWKLIYVNPKDDPRNAAK